MTTTKQNQIANYLRISCPFLSEIRSGKKSLSKKKARGLSQLTGLSFEELALGNGETLYQKLVIAYLGKDSSSKGNHGDRD